MIALEILTLFVNAYATAWDMGRSFTAVTVFSLLCRREWQQNVAKRLVMNSRIPFLPVDVFVPLIVCVSSGWQ